MAENKGDTSKRGFASMDDDKQRDIASKGGQSVPDEKRSFSQDPELASEAGKEGAESRSAQGGQGGGSSSDERGGSQSRQGQGGGGNQR
jgi:uncharacterized protein